MTRRWFELIWVFGLLFLVLSCSQSAVEKRDKHMKRADEYVAKQEFKKAIVEYKNAVQADPQSSRAHYQLALAYLKSGEPAEAFAELRRTADLDPDNVDAQLRLGELYLLANKPEEAAERAAVVLKKEPNNLGALFLQVEVLLQERKEDKATEILKRMLAVERKSARAYIALARIAASQRKYPEAREYLRQAVAESPQDSEVRLELAWFYEHQREFKEAESELEQAVSLALDKAAVLAQLGSYYVRRGDMSAAEKTYLKMAEAAQEKVEPKMTLAVFYGSQKKWDQALVWLKKGQEQQPNNLDIETTMASVYLDAGQADEAQKLIEKVLARDRGNVRGRVLKARLLFKQNKLKESAEILDGVLKDQPNYHDGHYYRGLIYLVERDQTRARASLLKAVEYKPENLRARTLLAEIYLSEGAADLALEQVTAILAREPENYRGYLLKGNAFLLKRNLKAAQQAYERAVEINQEDPIAYYQLAAVTRLEGRYDQALAHVDKALQLRSDYVPALSMKVAIYLSRKEQPKALAFLDSAIEKSKDNKALTAVLYDLRGDVLFTQQNYGESEASFRKAVDLNPDLISPYVSLARLYQEKKETDQAISQYQAILARQPKYLPAYMSLGAIYEANGKALEARTMYEKALEIKPDFAPAANNLAWMLLQSGQETDRAFELARKAKAQLPDDPNVADTLGLALLVKGLYLSALTELTDAAKKMPQNPTVLYHLSLAYWKNGDRRAAQETAQKALGLRGPFPEEKQAQELLKEIKASK